MLSGDLRQPKAGEVLVAEEVGVHLVGGGEHPRGIRSGLAVSPDELQRELLNGALGGLVHVEELVPDQLPVGDEPRVRLEAEEVLGRVDDDALAVDLDAGRRLQRSSNASGSTTVMAAVSMVVTVSPSLIGRVRAQESPNPE